jgi:3-isopropylmalate dehydrogenase
MFLSAAMMLDWLSDRYGLKTLADAAVLLDSAITRAFAAGTLLPHEIGGAAGTEEITAAVIQRVHSCAAEPAR